MILNDFELVCPNCTTEFWANDADQPSAREYEWECPNCGRSCYWFHRDED